MFERKYNAIMERSFKTKLELFLFEMLLNDKQLNEINEENFNQFSIRQEVITIYENAWQKNETELLGQLIVKKFDEIIRKWHKENIELKGKFLESYYNQFYKIFPMNEFEDFYKVDEEERKCEYCEISERQVSVLRGKGLIKTKRNRGKQMEVDRRNSNEEYKRGNVLLCCYWCNNAKTDEYSFDEFKKIGQSIKLIWQERFNKQV